MPLRVFVGSGEQSAVERKVLLYSLRKHTRRPLDVHVFNGTHNAIERDGHEPYLAPLPLSLKYRNLTEFSLYRYLIPQLCGFKGRAVYLDSDMLCLADIGELFDLPMGDAAFLAKRESPAGAADARWALSVMVIECARCRFDLPGIFAEIDAGVYAYHDFSWMGQSFLSRRPYAIGALPPEWNDFDRHGPDTKIVHYTNLLTQPWKSAGHPFGDLWFDYLQEAKVAGAIAERDIRLAVLRGYARPNIGSGNQPAP